MSVGLLDLPCGRKEVQTLALRNCLEYLCKAWSHEFQENSTKINLKFKMAHF